MEAVRWQFRNINLIGLSQVKSAEIAQIPGANLAWRMHSQKNKIGYVDFKY